MVDWSKPLVTKSGHPVRVLCTDRRGYAELEIVVLVDDGGREVLASCLRDGTGIVQGDDKWHVVNVEEVRDEAIPADGW